jgi:hypothetical protein
MPANYVLLEKITVGAAGASSVTFSGIPQTGYTDLIVNSSTRASAGSDTVGLQFNGDTGSNYNYRRIRSDGSAVTSGTGTAVHTFGGTQPESTFTANTFSNCAWYIPNYTGSTNKSLSADAVSENNATSAQAQLTASLWSNTAAITSITVIPGSGSFVQYSTFYLYGVAKLGTTPAIAPYATGGDTIMTDGTYWYHAFLSSGTFTPAKNLSCDVLVVAGGGSGGKTTDTASYGSGGGGAGGVVYQTARSIAANTSRTVTIGAGGSDSSGSNTTFDTTSTITANGGGRGANASSTSPTAGVAGGSGGGGTYQSTAGGATTQGSSGGGTGYGFAGGAGSPINGIGGGGGGAGGLGVAGAGNNQGGAGGVGLNTWSTWLSVTGLGVSGYIAGGGGAAGYGNGTFSGGSGGSGGGGLGGGTATGTLLGVAGVANTGSGAGGSTQSYGNVGNTGGAGGSGLVIVRYAV